MPELSLADELRALGRAARPDVDPDGLAARVVGALPARVEARRRVGRRVALAALAVLVALVAAPPVRATVAEWFGFGAVRVEPGGPPTRQSPAVPPVTGPMSLADAAALADFQLVAPAALGEPDGTVSSDDGSRVSMSWSRDGGTVRLDQLAGTPDYAMVKTAARVRFATVAGRAVLWFPTAHRVALLGRDGEPAGAFRVSDRTLLVLMPGSTVRLEGPLTFTDAAALARSLRPVR